MTFGTDGFRQSLTLLRTSAERFGITDFRAYTVDHAVLDRLRRRYPTIMSAARGAGYWLWKPHIIADTLASVPDGTVVVYTDAEVVYGRDPSPLLELADRMPIVAFRNRVRDAWQRRYTKRDCFVLLDADRPGEWNRHQLDACSIVFRASDASRSLVAEWAAACCDERALTDLPNRCGLPNFDDFVAHRHDQSILTIIAAKHEVPVLPPAKWTPHTRYSGGEFFYQHRQKTPLDDMAFEARLDALRRGSWPTEEPTLSAPRSGDAIGRPAKRRGPLRWGYRRSVGADLHTAAEARLAETLGWELDVVQGRKPIDNRGGSGAFELIEPAGLDFAAPTFEVLRVANWKRFGNAVRQLTNVFLVGERFGTERIEFPEPHPFFSGKQAGRFGLAWERPLPLRTDLAGLVPGRPGLMGDFYIVSGLGMDPDPDDLARSLTQYVRPLLVDALRAPRSDVGDNDMVLHFRGGDVFVPSKGKPIHPGYGQPPAAYYLAAVEREQPSQVWLVFEDHNNPCVSAVADGLKQRGVAFQMQSASLTDDLHLLLSAPCLVAGVGSFCDAIAALSTRLRKLFSFEWVEPKLSHLGVHTVVATDLQGNYRRLVMSDWQATLEQRALMLSYPADAIGFRDHPPMRRGSMQAFDASEGSP